MTSVLDKPVKPLDDMLLGIQPEAKPMKLVIVGHVDHGKSTLIGRILYDTHSLEEGKIEKVRQICEDQHKSFELAFLLDALEEEQLQGITIDTTQIAFQSENRSFLIIDAPGHKEFLKNMISGAAKADAAVLIIDAHEGVREQSRRHGTLLSLLGITDIVVVVNKMDLVNYDEGVFNAVKTEYLAFLAELNVKPLQVIPVSAREGDNVVVASEKMPWFKGNSLLTELEAIQGEGPLQSEQLRFCVQDVYKFDTRRIIAGRIESGELRVGDEIQVLPSGQRAKIESIEAWPTPETPVQSVVAGYTVGITLDFQLFVDRGNIIAHVSSEQSENNLVSTRYVTANVFWMGREALVFGKRYKLKIGPQEVFAFAHRINRVMNASSMVVHANANAVQPFEVGEVVFRTEQPLVADVFGQFTQTGRFVIVDHYTIAGGGIVSATGQTAEASQKAVLETIHTGRIGLVEREAAYGHCPGVIQLVGEDEIEMADIAGRLERTLFNSGFQAYYWADANPLTLETGLPLLLAAGLIVITTQSKWDESHLGQSAFLRLEKQQAIAYDVLSMVQQTFQVK